MSDLAMPTIPSSFLREPAPPPPSRPADVPEKFWDETERSRPPGRPAQVLRRARAEARYAVAASEPARAAARVASMDRAAAVPSRAGHARELRDHVAASADRARCRAERPAARCRLQPRPGAAGLRACGRATVAGDPGCAGRDRGTATGRAAAAAFRRLRDLAARPRASSGAGRRRISTPAILETLAASYEGVLALHQMMRASEPELLAGDADPAAELDEDAADRDDARPALLAPARPRVHRPRHGRVQAALRRLTQA